jgi:hypothetical protein
MERRAEIGTGGEHGSASLELIGTLPFLGIALLAAAQFVLTGSALWSAAVSARAGARAEAVGGDARAVARRALPPPLRDGALVTGRDGLEVRVRVPRLLPGMPRLAVGARSSLQAEDAGPR